MNIKLNKNWRVLIATCGLIIAYMPFGYTRSNTTATISFIGVVPDIKCDDIKSSFPSFSVLDANHDGRITVDEFTSIKDHEFAVIDFDANGYISPIELSVYKDRNCLM
ncbi:EF-hand domain-containing protein [Vibrio metschnikovii]|uniref:EF-hand domain-containing protein n=1 Tax=Vibrio metschnikovii TaxID=28172 RepID=UPI001C303264|nr:EF-hand domain-containing protein [Vibrio metschnikovii]